MNIPFDSIRSLDIKGVVPHYEGLKVDIIMIDSRGGQPGQRKKWVEKAKNSAEKQLYPGKLWIVNNRLKTYTIGECWNAATRRSEADFLFFLGDDDMIQPECTMMLVAQVLAMLREKAMPVVSTCCETLIDKDDNIIGLRQRSPTGLILRRALQEHPFDETLTKRVDTEYFERIRGLDGLVASNPAYFGYWYRQHDMNISGSKIEKPTAGEALRIVKG